MFEMIDNIGPYSQLFLLIMLIVLAILSIRSPTLIRFTNSFFSSLENLFGKRFEFKTYEEFNEFLKTFGYFYDVKQDIFYSIHDAWQRQMGYSRIFDEAAAPMSMIIDCEPIYFLYDNKKWLIEFWKGQYGMTTGCEIGVYYSEYTQDEIDNNMIWYDCVDDSHMLNMSFSLNYKGNTLMKREERHWWLTGFILGKFSNPNELLMYLNITFMDYVMRDEFINGLQKAGYTHKEILVLENTVGLKFNKPKTQQPFTRIKETDEITQQKNKLLCDKYNELTIEYDNILDKISAVQRLDPELFQRLFTMGKSKAIFSDIKNIKTSS